MGAGAILGAGINAGMGLLLEGHNDRRQLEQQRRLQALQIQGQKDVANYNAGLQMDLWNRTNYGAQMEQLKKAGLNPALLYSKGGQGGTTAAAAAQGPSMGNAPAGGMEVMNMMANQAQIELIKAQTEKTKVETTKTAGVDTAVGEMSIEQMKQQISSAKSQQALTDVQAAIANIHEHIAGQTQNAEISKILAATRIINNDASISDATKQDTIKRIGAETTGAILSNWQTIADTRLRNAQTKTERQKIEVMIQQIRSMEADIQQGWRNTNNEQLKTFFQNAKDLGLYNDNDPVKELIDQIILIPTMGKGGTTPIRGFHQR